MTQPDWIEIKAEIDAAWEALEDADIMFKRRRFRSAISRAYYAVFHGARAILWIKIVAPKTHKGVSQQFSLHFIKTKIVDRGTGKILKSIYDQRELADYHAMAGDFDNEEVRKIVADARHFVKAMDAIVREKS